MTRSRTRSTLRSRLALALLALAGFAAPAAQRELDGVVQTSGAGRDEVASPGVPVEVEVAALGLPALDLCPASPSGPEVPLEKRYLKHRAWLL